MKNNLFGVGVGMGVALLGVSVAYFVFVAQPASQKKTREEAQLADCKREAEMQDRYYLEALDRCGNDKGCIAWIEDGYVGKRGAEYVAGCLEAKKKGLRY